MGEAIVRYTLYAPGERKGNTAWTVRLTFAGKRVERSLGTLSKSEARQRALELINDLTQEQAREGQVTFAQAALAYLKDLPGDKGYNERKYLAPILEWLGPDRLIEDVTPQLINEAAHSLKPLAQEQTRHRCVKTPMRAVVHYHARGGRRDPRPDNVRLDWLTPEQFEHLVTCLPASPNPDGLRRLIFTAIGSGIRSEEAVKLQVSNVNPRAGQLFIADPKNETPRWAFIEPARALPELLAGLPEEGAVFRRKGGTAFQVNRSRSGGQFRPDLVPVAAAAEMEWVTMHIFRHTFATWFYAVNKDINALMEYGGWKTVSMAMRYTKLAPADLPERLAEHGWNFRIGGKLGGELAARRFNVV